MNDQSNSFSDPDLVNKQPGSGMPSQDEIEYLLGRIQPKPGARFYKQMVNNPWDGVVNHPMRSRVRAMALPAIFGLITVVLLVSFLPSLQALASQIARYFTPASRDHLILAVPLLELPDAGKKFLFDLRDTANLVGFEVKSPTPIPSGYAFISAEYKPEREAIILLYESVSGHILRISQRRQSVEYQSVSIQAVIETVSIGSQQGEFVTGGWKATSTQAETPESGGLITVTAEWDPDADIHFLRWQENDILYEILFIGNDPDSPGYLHKDDLIAIAENLH